MEPAAPRQGLQQQMNLSVMPQRLEMAYALHRGGNGLFVDHMAGAELHRQPEALGDDPL